MSGSRNGAIARAEKYFDDGGFLSDLQRRVAIPTTSQEQGSMPALQQYVSGEMTESLQKLGYDCTVLPNPRAEYGPFLIARRIEDEKKPTVLTYGHGDVIRGQEDQWRQGLSPWNIVIEGEKMYGRGTADNKGQHTINLAALDHVLRARGGRLGFNLRILVEGSEEIGSIIRSARPAFAFFGHYHRTGRRVEGDFGATRVYHLGHLELRSRAEEGSVGVLSWDGVAGDFAYLDPDWLRTVTRHNWKHR